MVRSLTEQQGGTVVARSRGLNQGSEFVVTLPTAPMLEQMGGDASGPSMASDPMTVLVVDDNVDATRMLALLLEAAGHRASVAHDGTTGLEAILSG